MIKKIRVKKCRATVPLRPERRLKREKVHGSRTGAKEGGKDGEELKSSIYLIETGKGERNRTRREGINGGE